MAVRVLLETAWAQSLRVHMQTGECFLVLSLLQTQVRPPREQWEPRASHRQQNWAVPPVPLVSGKRLITPLGCVVNGNSTSSSLFRFGGEMGDAVRYLRCNSAYWEDFTNPPFFKQEIKRSFWYPSFQTSFGQHPNPKPTPVFCQNHVITRLCSNFLLLLGALLFPLHLSFFFFLQQQTGSPHPCNSSQPRHCGAEQLKPEKHPVCLL